MSVEVTHLSTGLAVVTDAMPHLETASLGVWIGAGSRDERRTSTAFRICSSTWRSRAPRGARPTIAEIEAVAGISTLQPRLRRPLITRVLRADVPLALDVLSDILAIRRSTEELRREQNVIVQEIGAPRTLDDLIWDRLQETAFTGQPIGRSILGTPATVTRSIAVGSPPTWRATIEARKW